MWCRLAYFLQANRKEDVEKREVDFFCWMMRMCIHSILEGLAAFSAVLGVSQVAMDTAARAGIGG